MARRDGGLTVLDVHDNHEILEQLPPQHHLHWPPKTARELTIVDRHRAFGVDDHIADADLHLPGKGAGHAALDHLAGEMAMGRDPRLGREGGVDRAA